MIASPADLPSFETARLFLRRLTLADAEAFRHMTDHPAVTRVIRFLETPFTLAAAESLLSGARFGGGAYQAPPRPRLSQ